ncbi:5'-nucleotidase, C-terminal domain [Nonomuraea jiangxiensis]|uniref:5'-nucleotidase, C-terminal domain n=1 Tax=Nonomuraea jiangxiensis TaxID=633440 RepID=A0A1G8Q3H5_9ACTN|nr:5'-nucleotidase, C-terminal domain [Nonomuraea jiangxiensis]
MTGAQLKSILAYSNPQGWILTPSSSLRYTLEGGAVTELTLNGVPVADDQVIKIAANSVLMSGYGGFPQWKGTTIVYRGGLDDRATLASYLMNNSPVSAPLGDRVTIR